MTQEFKDYDKQFADNYGKSFQNLGGTLEDEAGLIYHKSWYDFVRRWKYETHKREAIQSAVYRAPGCAEWQFFRVGLKGLSTRHKLWCLWKYYESGAPGSDRWLRKIRIDNYLGALVRGGQLSETLEIRRHR